MPRTSEQFKQIKDERKSSILQNSLFLFAIANGAKVSIDQICEKAKCSHGLIYHYFRNSDEIYNTLLKTDIIKELSECLKVNKNEPAINSLKSIVDVLDNKLQNDENIPFVMLFLDQIQFKNTIEQLVKKGQKEGQVTSGDPKDVFRTCYYIYKGYCFNKFTNPKGNDILPDKDVIMQIFIRGHLL